MSEATPIPLPARPLPHDTSADGRHARRHDLCDAGRPDVRPDVHLQLGLHALHHGRLRSLQGQVLRAAEDHGRKVRLDSGMGLVLGRRRTLMQAHLIVL